MKLSLVSRGFIALIVALSLVFPVMAQSNCDTGLNYAEEIDRLLQNGQYDEAVEMGNCAVKIDPDNPFSYYLRGLAYFNASDFDSAIADLTQANLLLPSNLYTEFYLAMSYYGAGKSRDAIEHFDAALEQVPSFDDGDNYLPAIYAYRGWANRQLQRFDDAVVDFKAALKLLPDNMFALAGRAEAYANLHQYRAAIADFNHMIEISPTVADNTVHIGNRWVVIRNYAGLVADIETAGLALQLNPDDTNAYVDRAEARIGLGEYDAAMDDLNQAINLDARDARAYSVRGGLWAREGTFVAAIADFDRAIDLDPDNPDYYRLRASAYMQTNKYDLALQDYDLAIKIRPEPVPGDYLSRGITYSLSGDPANAAADFMTWADGVQKESDGNQVEPKGGTQLERGEPAQILMGNGYVFRFQFDAQSGEHLTLSAVATQPNVVIDTLIIVLGPDGTPLYGQDDVAMNQDPRAIIDNFEVPEDGEYTLVVTHAGGPRVGEVTVLVDDASDTIDSDT